MTRISFERVDSCSELQERLRIATHPVMLGKGDESHREYFLGTTPSCTIGICSQGHGPEPACLVVEQNNEAWLSFSSSIANVDLDTCRERFVLKLDGVLFTILGYMEDGSAIVIHELGACRVSRSGQLAWNHTTDVVTAFSDDGNVIRLQTDEGETKINKATGAIL